MDCQNAGIAHGALAAQTVRTAKCWVTLIGPLHGFRRDVSGSLCIGLRDVVDTGMRHGELLGRFL